MPPTTPDAPEPSLADLGSQLSRLRDQLAILAGARPTPAELADRDSADKAMARRIHQARPGVPPHHILATLEALRAVQEMQPPEQCCVCAGGPVVYHNYREQPFCNPCANCACGQDVCIRTGISDPAVSETAARAAALTTTLDEVLRQFVHKGHPGEPCLQTGWISVRTVQRWRAVLYPAKPGERTQETAGR